MDNLCHTLTGAAIGQAGLASRTRYGMATLMVAANLPDIDVAVFLTDTLPVSFRRGWTHGVAAQVVLPLALAMLVWVLGKAWGSAGRAPAPHDPAPIAGQPVPPSATVHFGSLVLLSYVGLYSHILLDFLNSYGVRLLMPFSPRWFYGDALYIVDPWLWIVLAGGLWLGRRARRRGGADPRRPARAALVAAGAYALVMLASNVWARTVVLDGLTRAGRPETTRFMVTPVFANPVHREVLIDTGDRYEKAFLWFAPAPRFRPAGYGVEKGFDQPEAASALALPRAQAFLRWSRFPFVVVDRTVAPPRLWLNDYRYSDSTGRAGWAGLSLELSPPGDEGRQ